MGKARPVAASQNFPDVLIAGAEVWLFSRVRVNEEESLWGRVNKSSIEGPIGGLILYSSVTSLVTLR